MISPNNRCLHLLVAPNLPTTLKKLQQLVDKLNFISILVPDYCRRVTLIMVLLKKTSGGTW